MDLLKSRKRSLANDPLLKPALQALLKRADKLLIDENVSVTQKSEFACSVAGDPHFYVSLSSYYWPDEADGSAPWVYKDGEYNRVGIAQYDFLKWEIMSNRVNTFTLAWWCTNKPEYALAAIEQIRTWFLDPKTFMLPNLDYAQTIPNKVKGSNAGIIDLNQIDQLVNSFGLIEKSPYWTYEDSINLKKWCKDMVNWLLVSEAGKRERSSSNNHGIYYDKILASFASYAGDRMLVTEILNLFCQKRVFLQIEPSGEMPHEMKRADAHHYLIWTLNGLISMAMIGENFEIDLWHETSSDGRSIKGAIEWSTGFINGSKDWPYPAKFNPTFVRFVDIFWRTSRIFGESHQLILDKYIFPQQAPNSVQSNILNITFPRHDSLNNLDVECR